MPESLIFLCNNKYTSNSVSSAKNDRSNFVKCTTLYNRRDVGLYSISPKHLRWRHINKWGASNANVSIIPCKVLGIDKVNVKIQRTWQNTQNVYQRLLSVTAKVQNAKWISVTIDTFSSVCSHLRSLPGTLTCSSRQVINGQEWCLDFHWPRATHTHTCRTTSFLHCNE